MLQLEKEGMKNKIFENPGYGKSNWFMPLTYHGDGEVVQHGPSRAALNAAREAAGHGRARGGARGHHQAAAGQDTEHVQDGEATAGHDQRTRGTSPSPH